MSKNVAVFVDVANIFYAAKAAGVDIDYVTLLKSATAGRDLVRAYAYTGLDPDNENQRNFHSFLARHGFRVVSKDIRKYGDGKVKANLDIELVVDMMKTARNLDIAIVVSGDGDFAPAIRAVQEMGVRVEVISFRGNTSSDLIEVADLFSDITALARVEKGSSRSGRRVAGDDQDLSMTEVPDKQTEGAGGRTRGRGRGRGKAEPEPAVAATGRSRRTSGTRSVAATAAASGAAAASATGAGLVALPGEKLSKASSADAADGQIDDEVAAPEEAAAGLVTDDAGFDEAEGTDAEAAGRRRRRRGGRGRGRGRGRPDGVETDVVSTTDIVAGPDEEEEPVVAAPRGPRTTPFGSVWDSQLGMPTTRPDVPPLADDEDFEEPEIPEYLIAERRRERGGGRGQGRPGGPGGRGARGAYAAAIDRERYGRGSGSGINRYPDVSGRDRGGRGGRDSRFDRPPRQDRPERQPARGGGSSEPWSEVPPEVEAMLRAQLQTRPQPGGGSRPAPPPSAEASTAVTESAAEPAPRARRGRRPTASVASDAIGETIEAAAAAAEAPARPTRRRSSAAAADAGAEASAPPKRTTRRRATSAAEVDGEGTTPAPKPRTRRTASSVATDEAATDAAAPRKRTTRRKTADTAEAPTD